MLLLLFYVYVYSRNDLLKKTINFPLRLPPQLCFACLKMMQFEGPSCGGKVTSSVLLRPVALRSIASSNIASSSVVSSSVASSSVASSSVASSNVFHQNNYVSLTTTRTTALCIACCAVGKLSKFIAQLSSACFTPINAKFGYLSFLVVQTGLK
jgi:hypothetical protein